MAICKGPWSTNTIGVASHLLSRWHRLSLILAVSMVRWKLLGFDEYSGWRIRTKNPWWRSVGKECSRLEGGLTDYICWIFQRWTMMMESKETTSWWFQICFTVCSTIWGRWSILTNIFSKLFETWNHQLDDGITNTHRIHVWRIYLHLANFCGKCWQIYHTWILWDMQRKPDRSPLKLSCCQHGPRINPPEVAVWQR